MNRWSRWYLIAWDLVRDDWRTFRLDRLREVRDTQTVFAPRVLPEADPAAYLEKAFQPLRTSRYVETVEVAAAPAELMWFKSWANVEVGELDQGRTKVTIREDRVEEVVSVIVVLATYHELSLDTLSDEVQQGVQAVRGRLG